ncbi:hypothetical protein [Clostridium formicaceticum]|uniref:DUF2680 domain-containing protein n=1 Tax=Clostridium formicaceticum TaxID=1497 RepID=A0AAC9RHD4_9CLOT|nr:hypothetical protein [Clostridium formicaceticum]AOY76585.1 hypothetical protein BJL90_12370 [Clostridium formicaceticum]ARE87004.1 hypothetical protein CLFO_13890 [Clostridium formicaceticum]
MKKGILALGLGLTLTIAGGSLAFADTQPVGNGLQLYKAATSTEELLELKLSKLDQMVSTERLTQEQADTYAAQIQERMNHCTNIGENRDRQERLAIGFGRTTEKGAFKGAGNRFGFNR